MPEAMIREFTIPMALMDFLPVVLFAAAAVIMLGDLYAQMGKGSYTLLSGGCIMAISAGLLKAMWKLLYAAGICDFTVLNKMFFPVQSVGFTLLGLAFLLHLAGSRKGNARMALAAAPASYSGTMLFVTLMVLGTLGLCGGLSALAARLRRKWTVVLFVLAFVLMLGMGYLSSRESASASMNWIEQSVNALGQLCLLLGVIDLHRHGIREK